MYNNGHENNFQDNKLPIIFLKHYVYSYCSFIDTELLHLNVDCIF